MRTVPQTHPYSPYTTEFEGYTEKGLLQCFDGEIHEKSYALSEARIKALLRQILAKAQARRMEPWSDLDPDWITAICRITV